MFLVDGVADCYISFRSGLTCAAVCPVPMLKEDRRDPPTVASSFVSVSSTETFPIVFSTKTLGLHMVPPYPSSSHLWGDIREGSLVSSGVYMCPPLMVPHLVSQAQGLGTMAISCLCFHPLIKLKSPVTLLFNAHLLVCFSQSAKHFQTETGGRNYLEL